MSAGFSASSVRSGLAFKSGPLLEACPAKCRCPLTSSCFASLLSKPPKTNAMKSAAASQVLPAAREALVGRLAIWLTCYETLRLAEVPTAKVIVALWWVVRQLSLRLLVRCFGRTGDNGSLASALQTPASRQPPLSLNWAKVGRFHTRIGPERRCYRRRRGDRSTLDTRPCRQPSLSF